MRTYTHGLIGWLIYLKGTRQQQILAAAGAAMPDVLLAIGFLFHFTPEWPLTEMLHDVFHHSPLHTVTIAMHSFTLIVPLLLAALVLYRRALPFFVGMLSHAIIDLLTHQNWGYNHFYPIDIPPFLSPFSYTNLWFTIAEHVVVVFTVIWLVRQQRFID